MAFLKSSDIILETLFFLVVLTGTPIDIHASPRNVHEGNVADLNIDISTMSWPKFRLLNLGSGRFVLDNGNNMLGSSNESYSNDPRLVWEYLILPQNLGFRIRNFASRKYLCFNRKGRPTMMNIQPPFINSPSCNMRLFYDTSNEEKTYIFNVGDPRMENWTVGLCPNGIPYTLERPRRQYCSIEQLNLSWNVFYVCRRVPDHCKDCELKPEGCSISCEFYKKCMTPPNEESTRMRV